MCKHNVRMCICVCVYACVHMYVCICMNIVRMPMFMCMHVCTYVYVDMYACVYLCDLYALYICMACMYALHDPHL